MTTPVEPVGAVAAQLDAATGARLQALVSAYAADERAGVRAAVLRARNRQRAEARERARLERLYAVERGLRREGYTMIAGVDEVGRGALAGPLTAGACILPPKPRIEGLNDSKKLSPARRTEIAARVREVALSVSVAHLGAEHVDSLGMTAALKKVMLLALESLDPVADHVVLDGLPLHLTTSETAVVGGDRKIAAIAAASVVAKVERDALMVASARLHPAYGFEVNKGYGTAEHVRMIETVGICSLHRRSFMPCAGMERLF